MKKAKEYTLIVLFNLLAIILILYGMEFLFSPYRSLPKDGWHGGQRYTWGHLISLNRFGFREREFVIPKPPDVYRVMVLGDSFTWGDGLALEERFTQIAEDLLNESQALPGKQIEVLNFGLRGASTVQERTLLKEMIEQVEPDLVVMAFTLNDTQPNEQNYSLEREQLDQKSGKYITAISRLMYKMRLRHLATSLHDAFYLSYERAGAIPDWETALGRTYVESSSEWQAFVSALQAIANIVDRQGLPAPVFAVLNQGTSTTEPTDYGDPDERLQLYLQWYQQAEAAAAQAGFVTYNHEQEIAAQLSDQPLAINPLDNHPSVALNRVYGEKLYQVISEILAAAGQ